MASNIFSRMIKKNVTPVLDNTVEELKDKLNKLNKYKTWVPPGHFYSPYADLDYVEENQDKIFEKTIDTDEINLNLKGQLKLLNKFHKYYSEFPFKEEKQDNLRYYFNNPAYAHSDSFFLYSMLRHFKPKKLIEVGSGFSSCVTLDTNDLFLKSQLECTFIEPYPELLRTLVDEEKDKNIKIIGTGLQDVELDVFRELNKDDILFIDSTHVSKVGSDVNYLFFKILPILKKGVIIHIHDIFYPFEYPKSWILEGRAWNEDYLIRAFLQYNKSFEILYFNHYMGETQADLYKDKFPLLMNNIGGSLWLRKLCK